MSAEFGGWRSVFGSKDIQCFELRSIRGPRRANGIYQGLLQLSFVEILHLANREYANVEGVMADDLGD
jgi:hypothetical protein